MKVDNRLFITLLLNFFVVTNVIAQQYDATLQWSKRAVLGTLSDGVVEKVLVDVGDKLKQGELMLQLDQVVFEKRVKQTAISQQSANQAYLEAKREKQRAEELYNRTVLSDHDLQLAKNSYIKAKSEYEEARLHHEQAKYDLKYSRIVAPFNALVLERHIQPGQVVKSELKPVPMLTVAESDRMRARILLDESDLSSISMQQSAKVSVGNTSFTGQVVSIAFEPVKSKTGQQTYPVDIEFATDNKVLRAGLSVKVEIQ